MFFQFALVESTVSSQLETRTMLIHMVSFFAIVQVTYYNIVQFSYAKRTTYLKLKMLSYSVMQLTNSISFSINYFKNDKRLWFLWDFFFQMVSFAYENWALIQIVKYYVINTIQVNLELPHLFSVVNLLMKSLNFLVLYAAV